MKSLIFPNENPIQILDKSYPTNVQMECADKSDAIQTVDHYISKNWSRFSISRGGNVTEYVGYSLTSVVIDVEDPPVVHFILEKGARR